MSEDKPAITPPGQGESLRPTVMKAPAGLERGRRAEVHVDLATHDGDDA